MKLALPELPPIAQAAIRSIGAGVLVGLWAWRTHRDLRLDDGTLRPGILVGLIFAAEFILLFLALARTDAARVVMLLYTAPFVVAVGARFLPQPEALTLDRWAGSRSPSPASRFCSARLGRSSDKASPVT